MCLRPAVHYSHHQSDHISSKPERQWCSREAGGHDCKTFTLKALFAQCSPWNSGGYEHIVQQVFNFQRFCFLSRNVLQLGRVTLSCHPSGSWSVKCMYSHNVLLAALMACPDQVGTPQGQRSVSCDVLVDNDWGTGSGWQQSKQNSTVSSVVG